MVVFLLTFILLLIVVAIMSIGVMMGRKPIAGSCGGIKALGSGAACEICGGDPNKCDSEENQDNKGTINNRKETELAYEVREKTTKSS